MGLYGTITTYTNGIGHADPDIAGLGVSFYEKCLN